MTPVNCKDCGLYVRKDDESYCYRTKLQIDLSTEKHCSGFIHVQYDGKEAYTPEQHIFLFDNEEKNKKMKNIQGLRF